MKIRFDRGYKPEIQSLGSATVDSLAGQFGLTAAQAAAAEAAKNA